MGHKFAYYALDLPLEEVLNRTHLFWEHNGGKINSQTMSPNSLLYTLIIKRGMSMRSYGEKYAMTFGYYPPDETTYVSIDVSLAFGSGMQWLKPQGIMKRWALALGTSPLRLERTISPHYISMFDEIQNIAPQAGVREQEPIIYCPNCGVKNNRNSSFCQECGTKLPI